MRKMLAKHSSAELPYIKKDTTFSIFQSIYFYIKDSVETVCWNSKHNVQIHLVSKYKEL